MKIAFFSPIPPAPTGIADYAADVLALLATRHEVEVFHDQAEVDTGRLPRGCRASCWREHGPRERYDVAVHQLGNGPQHDFVYQTLVRAPGLLVLHDLVLHHARARMFLASPEALAYAREPHSARRRHAARGALEAYQAEVAYSYPGQGQRVAEAHLGTVGDLLPYAYPLFRIPVEASRVTAVHNRFMAEAIREEVAEAAVTRVVMPVPPAAVATERVQALRARLGLGPDELVVGSFGLLTREKRVETVARAVARAAAILPRLRLLLVGPVPQPPALQALLERLGLGARAVVTGRVPLDELPVHIAACDLVVHLRYPTARETSAALLRVLAQGRPAVVSDLDNLDEVPADAVVKVDLADEEGEVTRAILRLAGSALLRDRLASKAARYVREEHSPARCLDSYHAALERTMSRPDAQAHAWPAHWRRP